MSFSKALICTALITTSGCVHTPSDNGKEFFYVVDGVVKLALRYDLGGNVVPWLERPPLIEGMDEVIIMSHGCSFYDVEYSLHHVTESNDSVTVRVQPGEFCNLTDLVFAHPVAVRVKRWDGINYFLDAAPISFADDGAPYITGVDLPEDWKLNDSLVDYPVDPSSPFCMDIKYFSPAEMERLRKNPSVSVLESQVCHTSVLPPSELRRAGVWEWQPD